MLAELIMCGWLVHGHPVSTDKEIALSTCIDVASRASQNGADPAVLIALSYHESRLNPRAISRSNAQGPLQVMPSQCRRWKKFKKPLAEEDSLYWNGCDLIAAGVWTWNRWRARSPNDRVAVCRYNAGYNCRKGSRSWRWAGAVVSMARKIKAVLDDKKRSLADWLPFVPPYIK